MEVNKTISTLRKIAAWVTGIIFWILVSKIASVILRSIGVTAYVDFGETHTITYGSGRYSYEDEVSGAFTAAGYAINFLTLMFAVRIGMAIYHKNINGGISPKGNIDFLVWAAGIALYGVVGSIIYAVFQDTDSDFLHITGNLLELSLIGGIFYFGRIWRDKKNQQLENAREQKSQNNDDCPF